MLVPRRPDPNVEVAKHPANHQPIALPLQPVPWQSLPPFWKNGAKRGPIRHPIARVLKQQEKTNQACVCLLFVMFLLLLLLFLLALVDVDDDR